MAEEFRLPDPGEGIHEAEIVEVCVAAGDTVEEGDIILHIETDKATVEVPSPYTGTVEDINVQQGDVIEVGDLLMTFVTETAPKTGKKRRPPAEAEEKESPEQKPQRQPRAKKVEGTAQPAAGRDGGRPIPASPATRRLAMELDVDLHEVSGSGPGGRVTADDVRSTAEGTEAAAERAPEPAAAKAAPEAPEAEPRAGRRLTVESPELPDFSRWGPVEEVPLHGVRRATARRMALAWAQIPHVMHQDVADISELEMFRRRHKADVEQQGGQLSLTVLVMQAVVAALKQFPRFNASLDTDNGRLILKHYYHIGVAVDTDRGLIVPVVRDVDSKSLADLAVELTEVAARVRSGDVQRHELQGGTFTLTNPGAIGGTALTPLINYPEVAILGLGRARLEAVVQGDMDDYTIVPRWHLPLHLAFDHRVNDGADAARFVHTLIEVLHDPEAFLLST